MITASSKNNIYIDALALVSDKKSGIGYTIEQTLRHLKILNKNNFNIFLVVPLGKSKYLKKYLGLNVSIKTIYLPAKILELLLRLNIFLPVDLLLGKGIYVFPNYRNWPLWHSRSITYIYDIGFIVHPGTVQPNNQKYLNHYIKRWITRTNRIVTITKTVKYEIEKYLNVVPEKIEVIYCGVDKKVFYKRSKNEIDAIKLKYNIWYDEYLIFVGNIEPRKNLIILLESYKLLSEYEKEKYGLVIIGGNGWLNEQFYKKLKEMQLEGYKILKIGKYVKTEDLPALYSGATVLIHPAIYEGFGLTPLEAIACETPVAISNIPAIKEIVQEFGFYFNPEDPLSIAKTVSQILSKNKQKYSNFHSAKMITKLYDWSITSNQLLQLISQIVSEGPEKPIVKRINSIYKKTDHNIRAFLDDKTLQSYSPRLVEDKYELRRVLYLDFLNEQPYLLKIIILKIYIKIKNILSTQIRKLRLKK